DAHSLATSSQPSPSPAAAATPRPGGSRPGTFGPVTGLSSVPWWVVEKEKPPVSHWRPDDPLSSGGRTMSAAQPPHASGRPPPPAPKGRNPLIRTSDRVEFWLRRALLLVLVAGMPLAAVAAGTAAYEGAMHTVQVQAAERQQVRAELISGTEDAYHGAKQQAKVRWSDQDGTVRTG